MARRKKETIEDQNINAKKKEELNALAQLRNKTFRSTTHFNHGVAKLNMLAQIENNKADITLKVIANKSLMRRFDYNCNHDRILEAIHMLTHSKRGLVSKKDIVAVTGLSRPTVDKHMKDIEKTVSDNEDLNIIRRQRLLDSLYTFGNSGYADDHHVDDKTRLKAIELFLKFTQKAASNISTNNTIKINNLQISTEVLEQLPQQQLKRIEEVIYRELSEIESMN